MRAVGMVPGLLAVLLVAACGGGATPTGPAGPTTPAGPTSGPGSATSTPDPGATQDTGMVTPAPVDLPDPCPLITQDDAATAVGAPVAGGVEEQMVSDPVRDIGRVCSFAGSGEGEVRVSMYRELGELWELYREQQGQFGGITDLPGVGDMAFAVGNYECNVVKGAVLMVVSLRPDSYDTDPEPRMLELCRQAAARL